MSGKHVTFFGLGQEQEEKEMITPKRKKRHERLTSEDLDRLRNFSMSQDKPQIDVSLPYSEPPIMTPRHKR